MVQKNTWLTIILLATTCLQAMEEGNSPHSVELEKKTIALLCSDDKEVEVPYKTAIRSTVIKDLLEGIDCASKDKIVIPVVFNSFTAQFLKEYQFKLWDEQHAVKGFINKQSNELVISRLTDLDNACKFLNLFVFRDPSYSRRIASEACFKLIKTIPNQRVSCWQCNEDSIVMPFNDELQFYDLHDTTKNKSVRLYNGIKQFVIAHDGKIFTLSNEGGCIIYNKQNEYTGLITGSRNRCIEVFNNRIILAGDCLSMWETSNNVINTRLIKEAKQDNPIYCMATSNDYIITGHKSGWVNIWYKNSINLAGSFKAHDKDITRIIIDGDALISASGKEIKRWDIKSQKCLESHVVDYTITGMVLYKQKLIVSFDDTIELRNKDNFDLYDFLPGVFVGDCLHCSAIIDSIYLHNNMLAVSYFNTCLKHKWSKLGVIDLTVYEALDRIFVEDITASQAYLIAKLAAARQYSVVKPLEKHEKVILDNLLSEVKEQCGDEVKVKVEKIISN